MDAVAFATWLGGIGLLDRGQRAEAFRELALAEADDSVEPSADPVGAAVRPSEGAVAPSLPVAETDTAAPEEDLLSKVGRGRIGRFGCPHCGGDEIRPWGKACGKPRYRCASCRKTFNPLTGTPLAGLHHRDRWPDQARALIAGETVAKAAERCQVAYTTAFRWRHRFPVRAQSRQAAAPVRDRRGGRDLHPRILQGQTPRSAESIAQAGRQGRQAGSVGGADPSHRRPRPHRRDHRCRPAAARRRQHHGRARAGHYRASRTVLRWRCSDHRIRSARPGQGPCLARARHTQPGGARSPHQQCERHGRLKEWMRRFPWRRHQEPPQLSELAANDRGPLNRLRSGRPDHGRRRIRSMSTAFRIRA